MCKKFFISIVTAIIVIISGTKSFKYFKDDNSVEENIVKETCTNEILSTDTVNEEVKENTEVENSVIEKIDDNKSEDGEVQINNKNKENKNNAVIKNDKSNNITVKNQTVQVKKEQKTTSNAEINNVEKNDTKMQEKVSSQEPQKTQTNNTNEKDKEQKITEEYIYNDTATKKLINDINEIAKKNPDLWGSDGKKTAVAQRRVRHTIQLVELAAASGKRCLHLAGQAGAKQVIVHRLAQQIFRRKIIRPPPGTVGLQRPLPSRLQPCQNSPCHHCVQLFIGQFCHRESVQTAGQQFQILFHIRHILLLSARSAAQVSVYRCAKMPGVRAPGRIRQLQLWAPTVDGVLMRALLPSPSRSCAVKIQVLAGLRRAESIICLGN